MANAATPGYRARTGFGAALARAQAADAIPGHVDLTQGKLQETGAALDIALAGPGYLEFAGPAGSHYSRNGQLSLDEPGRLVGPGGRAVQAEGGGDVIPGPGLIEITEDGTVLVDGAPLARLALMEPLDAVASPGPDGLLRFVGDMTPSATRAFRQGWLEGSNVTLGQEMVLLMEAVRRAETGQRLMHIYDDLMGRVVTTFGQSTP